MTSKWRNFTGNHLELAIEGRQMASLRRLTSYKAVARRRLQSHDRKWWHITSGDKVTWKWCHLNWSHLEVVVEGRKVASGAFHFLQGCSSQVEAVTWQKMTWRDLRWPEVTRKCRHLIRSHLEVAIKGRKLEYAMHFTSYKAVARRMRQSRDWKWREVTSGNRKWPRSDVIWPEVTWKWL